MKARYTIVLSILTAMVAEVAFLGVAFVGQAGAQGANDTAGAWWLVSVINEKDGQKVEPYGPNPKGIFMLDGKHFSLIVTRPGRNKYASNNRLNGTADENKETVRGSLAYFGTYTVDAKDKSLVTFHIEGSTFPNWEGAEQKRVLKVDGDQMDYTNPTITTGAGVARLVWKRAK